MNGVIKPRRIQQRRRKGWRMPANTVSVARPSKWGNPYSVETYDREKAVAMYREYLTNGKGKKLSIKMLSGKNLACFCSLDQACHADLLLEIANA
jgi:hypothetical protein